MDSKLPGEGVSRTAGIAGRLKKLEVEMRDLRSRLQENRESALEALPDPLEVLIGKIGDQSVALPVRMVLEVLPRVFLDPVPESPAYLSGYLRWRGLAAGVIDPSARWSDMPLPVRLEDRIVLLSLQQGIWGILLNEVEQIAELRKEQLSKIGPEIPAAPYALALFYSGERNILLLDPETLVDPAVLAKYALP